MNDAEANDMADKLAIRMVGIVSDMIASDKRLASSIAAILDEKIGKRLAEIEMTMGLIEDKDEDELPYLELKRAIFEKCKSSNGVSNSKIFDEEIRIKAISVAGADIGEADLRDIEHKALSEMVSDGDIQKISNGKYSYLYKSNCAGDIF